MATPGEDFVHRLSSGAQPTSEEVGPHPVEVEDVDRRMREMEQARDAAAVSGDDYLMLSVLLTDRSKQ